MTFFMSAIRRDAILPRVSDFRRRAEVKAGPGSGRDNKKETYLAKKA
jgi:hypothetical protein